MPEIPEKWLALAADLLDMAADHYANHGCNDYALPADWTPEERLAFERAMMRGTGWGEEDLPDRASRFVHDAGSMRFLAGQLREVSS